MRSVRLLHFTDLHLFGAATARLRGIPTLESATAALAHARARHWPPEAVLVSGDIVHDDPRGYAQFQRLFAALGPPVLCLPGNHDDPDAMRRALDHPPFVTQGYADVGLWRIVLLDSVQPGQAGGALDASRLTALEEALAQAGERPELIALHHHPVPMGSRWLDQVALAEPDALFAVLDRHPGVRGIVWGHVHQSFDAQRNGVRLLATPSTCAQFRPRTEQFALDPLPPAYRTLVLHADGAIDSQLHWVESGTPRGH
jgi:Icc protein